MIVAFEHGCALVAALLDGAIASLLKQSLPPFEYEILVIDNASTDATPAVIGRYLDLTRGRLLAGIRYGTRP